MTTSRFAIVRKSIVLLLISKKDVVPKKYEYEVDEELGGGKLSLFACLGVGNRQKKKFSNSRGYAGRGAW